MSIDWFGRRDPDARGYFGSFGGRFVPETLVAPIEALEQAYLRARLDPAFVAELDRLFRHYVGRPTPLWDARRLSSAIGGARILLKREDLTHTGAHTISTLPVKCPQIKELEKFFSETALLFLSVSDTLIFCGKNLK